MIATIVRYIMKREPVISIDLFDFFKSDMPKNISKAIAPINNASSKVIIYPSPSL